MSYSPRSFSHFFCGFLLFSALTLAGCAGSHTPVQNIASPTPADQSTVMVTGARRADPGYVQYLERLSMLGSHTELARIVSGSQLAWLRPADAPYPDPLLGLADTWLSISPLSLLPETKRSAFASMATPRYWQIYNRARIGGVYLAPASGSGGLWAYNRRASLRGEDVIQYTFSEAAGSEDDYFSLLSAANVNRKLVGLELTPAATGLGPDFFLAARYHRQFSGLYCMVELPQQLWPTLPTVTDQWRGEALSEAQIAALAAQNLLPHAMVQDFSPIEKNGGWAVTTEIYGVDGLPRRWAYRYHETPDKPILNWEDPSAAARKIMSGSVIKNVGVRGGALVGMRLKGLYGLDTAIPRQTPAFSVSPADQAAIAISREVRRYGGWSYLRDELPLSATASLMESGPDFFHDNIFSPGMEHAILTGSTELLRTMTDEALARQLDMRRFVHGTPSGTGVSYEMAHLAAVAEGDTEASTLSPAQAATLRKGVLTELQNAIYATSMTSPKGNDVAPFHNRTLYTTPTGLGALALGAGNAHSVTKEMEPDIFTIHMLQVFFRSMLPGLLMISGQDIAGTLPLSWYDMENSNQGWDVGMASRGAYALTQSAFSNAVTPQGIARVKHLYPTADVQQDTADSLLSKVSEILSMRTTLGIAGGKLLGRFDTQTSGCFALAIVLPSSEQADISSDKNTLSPHKSTSFPTTEGVSLRPIDKNRTPTMEERRKQQYEEDTRRRAELELRIITVPHAQDTAVHSDSALIVAFNFSREPATREVFTVTQDPILRSIREKGPPLLLLQTNSEKTFMSYGPTTVTLSLPPWSGAAVLIGKKPQ